MVLGENTEDSYLRIVCLVLAVRDRDAAAALHTAQGHVARYSAIGWWRAEP
jgi:hypothetical protein